VHGEGGGEEGAGEHRGNGDVGCIVSVGEMQFCSAADAGEILDVVVEIEGRRDRD
jgi:hypothetical protein